MYFIIINSYSLQCQFSFHLLDPLGLCSSPCESFSKKTIIIKYVLMHSMQTSFFYKKSKLYVFHELPSLWPPPCGGLPGDAWPDRPWPDWPWPVWPRPPKNDARPPPAALTFTTKNKRHANTRPGSPSISPANINPTRTIGSTVWDPTLNRGTP